MLRAWEFIRLQRSRSESSGRPLFSGRAAKLFCEHGRSNAAATRRPRAVLDGDIIVYDDAFDRNVFGSEHLGGELEIHDITGVVLHDMQSTLLPRDRLGGGMHLIGRRAGENGTRASGVEHALSDEPSVHWFMPAPAA